ncbi:SixA phosphatase family protein [Robiginitalea aurantiaca]|uniref:Phosphoglycerate mutase family protein n=1 Tax=Robiginitalea aurantiaca TaxID=3056915 RepID=A0ABT7WGE5_9FLAO|nr:phosphoglycerate mutase family protein [Robiginitalea aurantiaca]MDM9631928.1 phosphoglycerate mutase family protein [Robiginitalea aurantiaca]
MKIFPYLFLGICLLTFWGCKDTPVESKIEVSPVVSTYYLIRHAEKDRTDPENKDPELNQRGLGRAMHWAEIFDDIPLDAIYSTDYARTTMTAAPSAVKKDITVSYYDPEMLGIESFKAETMGKNVLIVGHSNSTPAMVNRLIGAETYAAMEDTDNGSLFIVTLVGETHSVVRLHFNCNCPE